MSCFTPLKAYRTRSVEGCYGITFDPSSELIIGELKLPCGQCIGCRLEYSRNWAIRCVHESKMYEKNCFITLTYSDQYLPEKNSLNKSDFQLFMKRLRKKFPKKLNGHIGYFQCGEYGENYGRPHHHACLFNFDFEDKILWKNCGETSLYTSKTLDDLWEKKGWATIGEVTFESAAYVARYVTKKLKGKLESHYGEKIPEYCTQSRRPAIGRAWIEKYYSDVYPSNEVIMNEKSVRPPRYYDKYLEKNYPKLYERVMQKRAEKELDFNLDEKTPERLLTKYELNYLKLKDLKRDATDLKNTIENSELADNLELYDKKIIDYLRSYS